MTERPSPDSRQLSALPTAPRPTSPAVRPASSARPEPLVGDGAVAKHLAGPDVRVGGQQVTGGREQQGERHLGDGVGVAARRVEHRDPGVRRARDVDVVRVAAGRGDGPQRQFEHRAATESLSTTSTSAVSRAEPLGQLLGAVDPQRASARSTGRRPRRRARAACRRPGPRNGAVTRARSRVTSASCWRTVTRVSAEQVTIGIDIGTTAVKAVAADEDGRVVARTRIPHQLRIPAPDRLEHDADEAWRQGPLAAVRRTGQARREARWRSRRWCRP